MKAVDDALYAGEAALVVDWTTRNNFRNSSGAVKKKALKQMAVGGQMGCIGDGGGTTGRDCKERSKGTLD